MTHTSIVIVDVWGGENSMDHVARFIMPVEQALIAARHELAAGFLVNLRSACSASFGVSENFDSRVSRRS